MADRLIIRGGTVVSTTGRRVADVAIEAGRITAVEDRLGEVAGTRESTRVVCWCCPA